MLFHLPARDHGFMEPAHANRDTARRVVPLFRPYRVQVAAVVGLIVVTSTVGIINPLLIQVVFNKALFVHGGPNIRLLVILVSIMAVVPIVNGAIGIVQTYGVYASLYQEQFDGGKVQWQCTGGDIMADGTIRHRQPQPA
jgi:ABC-type bacteriocin/lantibiotic exporter with double-glycine peptidase domain